jgi:YVTN family beta-propeller protein
MASGRHRQGLSWRRLRSRSSIVVGLAIVAVLAVASVAASLVTDRDSPRAPRASTGAARGPSANPPAAAAPLPSLRPSPGPSVAPARPLNLYAAITSGRLSPAVASFPERVYVPNSRSGTVSVIDPYTYKVIALLTVGEKPHHVTPSWDLQHLYVDNSGNGTLAEIDPKTGKLTGTMHLPSPYNLYFTPDGRKAIDVAEYQRRIVFYDPHSWKPIRSVPIPWPGVDHMDFSADGRYFLVSCEYSGVVVKVSTARMAVVGTIQVGGLPIDVKISPDGKVFYVANQGRGGVSVIDPARMEEIAFIPTGAGAHGFAVSRNARYLYLSNRLAGTISVISFATRRVVATWHVGGSPDMLQVSPDGRELWTSNRFGTTVSVISTITGRVIHTIRVGYQPHGLAYFPQPGRFSLGHNGVYR